MLSIGRLKSVVTGTSTAPQLTIGELPLITPPPITLITPSFTMVALTAVARPGVRLSVPIIFRPIRFRGPGFVVVMTPLPQSITPSTISSFSTLKMPVLVPFGLRLRLEELSTRDCSCITKVPLLISRLPPLWRNKAVTVSVLAALWDTASA